jgi:PAS domain S-box-containing protein
MNDIKTKRARAVYVFIFFLLAVGIIVGGYVSYRNFEREFRRQAEHQISAVAELKVDQLADWRWERLNDAQSFLHNQVFSALVERYFNDPADLGVKKQIALRLEYLQSSARYNKICLLDTSGVQRLSVPASSEELGLTDLHLTDEVLASLDLGQVVFLDFQRETDMDGRIYISVLAPIFADHSDHRSLGVLVLHIDPETYLYPSITRWPIPSETAETLLVRRDGQDVLFLNQLRFEQDAALSLRYPLTRTDLPAVQAVLGRSGILEGTDYRGKPVLADVRPVPDSPWFLISKMDAVEVYAPLRARLWQTLLIIGMAVFVAGMGLVTVWRQQRLLFYRAQVEATEALRASEEKFRKAFIISPDSININRLQDGMYISINNGFTKIMGYLPEEVIGKTSLELNIWADPQVRLALVDGLKKTGEIANLEARFRAKNGDVKHGLMSASVLELNGVPHIISITRDITERKRAETELADRETLYRNLFETMIQGVVYQDRDGRITSANNAAQQILGLTLDEMQGRSSIDPRWNSIHEDGSDFPGETHPAMLALQTGKPVRNVIIGVFNPRIEATTWILVHATPEFLPGEEKPYRVYTTFEDITERKQAEESRKQAELRYRALFEQSHDAIFILDFDGRHLAANQRAEDMLGYRRDEILKLSARDISAEVDQSYSVISQLIAGEHVQIYERLFRKKDGQIFPVEINVELVRDERGNPLHIQTAARDITERKQAEVLLMESENLYRKMNENSPLGMHFYKLNNDDQLIFAGANPAADKLLGVDNSQFIGKTIEKAFPPLAQTEVPARYRGVAAEGIPWSTEQIAYEDDRIMGAFEVRAFQTTPGNMVAVFADVTERKQAEEKINQLNLKLEQRVFERTVQLETANKELEAFSYSVSHDLRAPLRGIDGWSQALLEDYGDCLDEQGHQYIDRVRSETQHMGHLIDDMLQLSRLTRIEMVTGQVELSALAQTIVERLKRDEPHRKVDFDIQTGIITEGDSHLLEAALANLLENAFKFTAKRADARIEFGETELEGRRVFFLRDNGAGFDMTYAQKLFGAFQRMHKASEFPGTGVGLATVQRIIHRHGGRVWAESKVGLGATFYFTLG